VRVILCVVAVVLAAAVCLIAQDASQDVPYTLKLNASLVSVDVGVFDGSERPITNLGKEDFQIFEDGVRQDIRTFTPVSGGYSILLLIDHSGSMRSSWPLLLDALNEFMKRLRTQDQVAIATFDDDIEVAMDWRSAQNGNAAKIAMTANGRGTDIWNAVDWAVREVGYTKGRKGVIVFTDGGDRGRMNYDRVLQKVVDSGFPFYFVGMTTSDSSPQGNLRMKQMAEASGGRIYLPNSASELTGLYKQIAAELGAAYTLGYSPKNPPGDAKLRHIQVRPIDVRLHVTQSRTSYYAK